MVTLANDGDALSRFRLNMCKILIYGKFMGLTMSYLELHHLNKK